ncbi:MAG: cobyric acid synthase [Proteobacteria bacterium]|nr:cobyric acid synthase [Pseudomonadota bacterium]
MIQGTGSDIGKSLLVAGLARAYTRMGLSVRPFKPQNMSNNAAVTAEGGEIGRAQALQARACGVKPVADMNPVLLKPESERGAQVVVQGRVAGRASALDYHQLKPSLMPRVLESFGRLAAEADLVLVEGAGSPAEVNLREADIANMGFAEAADLPVLLVADIDRGGAIASLVGTHALLSASERYRLKGYLINKFRGDPALFEPALAIIAERIGLSCLGIVPWFAEAGLLPAEDAMALERPLAPAVARPIKVAVPRLARIANFDDLDPLRGETDVSVEIVPPGKPLPEDATLVLLPGSKATLADLRQLRAEGWDIDILAHHRRGGRILGLCAGYQMLGRSVSDPDGIEGSAGTVAGLGLLDVETVLTSEKTLVETRGRHLATGTWVAGYEMHLGRTEGPGRQRPALMLGDRPEGACSDDGLIEGCYLHGIFAADAFRQAFLARLRNGRLQGEAYEARIESILDHLADHLAASIDLARVLEIARAR